MLGPTMVLDVRVDMLVVGGKRRRVSARVASKTTLVAYVIECKYIHYL